MNSLLRQNNHGGTEYIEVHRGASLWSPLRSVSPWLFLFFLIFSFQIKAIDYPSKSRTIVTDYTNTLSQNEGVALEQKLVAFNDTTSSQIAVVIIPTTGGMDIAEYTVNLINKWGIGRQGKNNGVLILVAKDDHKTFIGTGYGMEGILPDATCKRIVEEEILPNFRKGDYYAGLDQGTSRIMALVAGEYTADQYTRRGGKQGVPWFFFGIFFFVFFVVALSWMRRVNRYAMTNHLAFWAAWAILSAASRRSRGSWGGFTGGGGWGGGGGFGGGGGGFGGFGGGMSGGGGAGGSW